ncbi:hypothetical protein AAG570_001646 [Ranatra chinensis]|uniref:Uncharacterized protein n=1 Tax=Ranatra chinensis TaxID=642074 RepID=A0ABD0Y9F1_9HEMI
MCFYEKHFVIYGYARYDCSNHRSIVYSALGCAGHCRLHQEGIRPEVQPDLALRRRSQLRQLCDPRNPPLHLLPLRHRIHTSIQVWLTGNYVKTSKDSPKFNSDFKVVEV